ncbi:MAG: ABC transporter ATP-binding protein [Solirubrobacterales bacterium]
MTTTETTTQTTGSMLSIPEARRRQVAIEVRDVEKVFRIPTQRLDTLKERVANPFAHRDFRELRALDGVSFDVERGEFFGIVGRNGSGKSTLMKLLASIYRADAGRIRVAGRLAPFIELGVGFNLELNARDNVVLNGVMMGLTPREARRRFDEIIAFAELEQFADLKMKNFSSGMLVRLGFSLMIQVDADVLLIDEVLAVGDASFQQKCFDAFGRLHQEGRTIVLVTHDMSTVDSRCDRALLLESGRIECSDTAADVARRYLELNFGGRASEVDSDDLIGEQLGGARFLEAWVENTAGERAASVPQGEGLTLHATVEAAKDLEHPVFGFQIYNDDGVMIFAPAPFALDGADASLRGGERVRVEARIENPLAAGHYFVHCAVGRGRAEPEVVAFRKNAADFVVYGTEGFRGMVGLDYEARAYREPEEGDE